MTSQRTRARMVERLRSQGIRDERVLEVMGSVPRHIFVDDALSSRAYDDTALPIGFGQTISSPYIVAQMTALLMADHAPAKVLEIGTGCGYQTAILAHLANEVYSVERIRPLLSKARKNLLELRLRNIKLIHADGLQGLEGYAPFDGIVAAAAARHVPDALLQQLAVGGRLIIPVGTDDQVLYVYQRTATGIEKSALEEVKFVPLLPGSV